MNFDVFVQNVGLLFEVVVVVKVLLGDARAEKMFGVEEEVHVTAVIRVSVRADQKIDLLGRDVVKFQLTQQNVLVPGCEGVDLKGKFEFLKEILTVFFKFSKFYFRFFLEFF